MGTNRIIYVFCFIMLSLISLSQVNYKVFKKSRLTYKEYGLRIIDSLKTIKVDTIIAYNTYKTNSVANEEFDIVYIKNKVRFQVSIIKSKALSNTYKVILQKNVDPIFFDIVFENKNQMISLLENMTLFEDTILANDNKILTGGLPHHGIGYYFYVKIGDIAKSNDYCCNISLNEKIYKRAFPLWQLASAFNNMSSVPH